MVQVDIRCTGRQGIELAESKVNTMIWDLEWKNWSNLQESPVYDLAVALEQFHDCVNLRIEIGRAAYAVMIRNPDFKDFTTSRQAILDHIAWLSGADEVNLVAGTQFRIVGVP